MKKLMIAVAALAMAVSANAAATMWKSAAANIYDSTGSAKFSGTAYVFCAEMLAADTLKTALSGKTTAADVTSYLAANKVGTATVDSGTISSTLAANTFTTPVDSKFVVGSPYNFYYVIVDGDKYLVSGAKGPYAAQNSSAVTLQFANQQTYTQTSSNWQSVPEPTSGLLLLLGVAGLALKRRRA